MKIVLFLLLGATPLLAQSAATPTPAPKAAPVRKAYPVPSRQPASAKPRGTPAPAPKATPPPKAAPKGKPGEPTASPTPKKRSILSRIFGPDEHPRRRPGAKPSPTVLPAATPAPTPKPRRKPAPAPTPATEVRSQAGDEDLPTAAPPAPAPKPKPPVPATSSLPAEADAPAAASTPVMPGEFDRARYVATRKKALETPEVVALAGKVNAAAPGDAAKAAAREYTGALFKQIRTLDPEQKEWYDRLEAATLRRIDAGKPFVAE